MPQYNIPMPTWAAFANTLIDRLRRHHGVPSAIEERNHEPSELDQLFDLFDSSDGTAERFASAVETPSCYIPARQLLSAIRIAAAYGSAEAELASHQCGALTVIRNIALEDLTTIKDTLHGIFPKKQWEIIAPDVVDGALAKTAQERFNRIIADSLDRIEPVLVLQTDGVTIPKNLVTLGPPILPLASITGDVLAVYIQAGHLCDQISNLRDLRAALPNDQALTALSTTDACAALRAPTLHKALQNLGEMTKRDVNSSGPRLEDITGDSPALRAARRIVDDLLLWRQGKAGWHEISRSILFYGPPGTGKSWLAQAMGNSAGINVVMANFGGWQSAGHLGDMLREMKLSFADARKRAPCLLIIDEIDAVGSRVDPDRHASNYRAQVITTFLAELDAISRKEGVIVVGTCNSIERMDPAVLRAGRMDVKVKVPMPDAEAILAILRHHLLEDIADHELQDLARLAVGRSAAELDAAIRAARSDARHSRKMLNVAMLHDQMNIAPDSENLDRLWRIAVHEAGHAIMCAALQVGSVDAMWIDENGGKVSGQTNRHQSLLSDIEAEIAVSLGGRAAERLVLGDVSAGAGGPETSDLATATAYAIKIETTYGLGYEGLVWHAMPDQVHQSTPAIRDRVRQRLMRAEDKAFKILTKHRDTLEKLARELLQKRSMRTAEIEPWLREVVSSANAPSAELPLRGASREKASPAEIASQ